MGENRTCGCRGIPQQVCDECQGPPVHLHDYDPSCVESRVGECVLDRVEAKVGNLDSGRHPRWQRVEPGTVIPAGQPYRVEYPTAVGVNARECTDGSRQIVDSEYPSDAYFVDSSWRPPLDLPTDLSVIRAVMPGEKPFLLTGPYPGDYWTDQQGGIFRQAEKHLISCEVLWTVGPDERLVRTEATR